MKRIKKFHKGVTKEKRESTTDHATGHHSRRVPNVVINDELVNHSEKKKDTLEQKPFLVKLKHSITKKEVKLGVRLLAGAFSLSLLLFYVAYSRTSEKKVLGVSTQEPNKSTSEELSKTKPQPPEITATSGIAVSTKRDKILFAKNPDLKLPPASTTKILTALVAIKNFNLSDVVEVPVECVEVEGAKMGLFAKENINVENLLYGLLVPSAADAACTLASYHSSSGAFLVKMNDLAKKIGLSETSVTNVVGFDSDDGSHVSSARDLYLIAKEAMKNGTFRKIVGTKDTILYSSDGKFSHRIVSTNKLLFELPGTLGIKTGTTPLAKEVLVYSYQFNDDELLIVVMGSLNRFTDTKLILDYATKNFDVLVSASN